MSPKTESKVFPEVAEAQESRSPFAVLFQLEEVAVSRRRVTVEVLKREFGEEKKFLEEPVFLRALAADEPDDGVAAALTILGHGKEPDEAQVKQVQDKILKRLAAGPEPLAPEFRKLLQAAQRRKLDLHALTGLPEPDAEALAGKLGLPGLGVTLLALKDAHGDFSKAETWRMAAKHLDRWPRQCGVLVAGKALCRAALAAGMTCVAVPDEFTSFDDFGGATLVLEAWNDLSPDEVLDALFPARNY